MTLLTNALAGPRLAAAAVAVAGWAAILWGCARRARWSRYPALLWTCAIYLSLLHLLWLAGLVAGGMMDWTYGTIMVLTFPWSMAVVFHITMAGFRTLPDLVLNYIRFILGFGGLQSLLLVLFVWELRLRPRRIRY